MIVRKGLAAGASLALVGVTLVGCGSNNKVKKGTVYEHKYSNGDAQYVMSVLGGSTNIEGKVGSIKIASDEKSAYLKNFVYLEHLYSDGEAKVDKITKDSVTISFKLKAGEKQIGAYASAKLPKNESCIEVPLGYDGYIVKFNKQTK